MIRYLITSPMTRYSAAKPTKPIRNTMDGSTIATIKKTNETRLTFAGNHIGKVTFRLAAAYENIFDGTLPKSGNG